MALKALKYIGKIYLFLFVLIFGFNIFLSFQFGQWRVKIAGDLFLILFLEGTLGSGVKCLGNGKKVQASIRMLEMPSLLRDSVTNTAAKSTTGPLWLSFFDILACSL